MGSEDSWSSFTFIIGLIGIFAAGIVVEANSYGILSVIFAVIIIEFGVLFIHISYSLKINSLKSEIALLEVKAKAGGRS